MSTLTKSSFGILLLSLLAGRNEHRLRCSPYQNRIVDLSSFLFLASHEPKLLTFRSSELFIVDYNDDWIINQIRKKESLMKIEPSICSQRPKTLGFNGIGALYFVLVFILLSLRRIKLKKTSKMVHLVFKKIELVLNFLGNQRRSLWFQNF